MFQHKGKLWILNKSLELNKYKKILLVVDGFQFSTLFFSQVGDDGLVSCDFYNFLPTWLVT